VLAKNLEKIQERIYRSCGQAKRDPSEIRLIWVSKNHPINAVEEARSLGAIHFGENRVQEALDKFSTGKPNDEELHIIGPIQSNKLKKAVQIADWIETVDSLSTLNKLNDYAVQLNKKIKVLFQVNTSGEIQKNGILRDEIHLFLHSLTGHSNIIYNGLMTIAMLGGDIAKLTEEFSFMRIVRDEFRNSKKIFANFTELSMGMSDDLEVAIEHGSTQIRVGTALFGNR
jgi:PLP dependent protein